jgi:hypothetical protein
MIVARFGIEIPPRSAIPRIECQHLFAGSEFPTSLLFKGSYAARKLEASPCSPIARATGTARRQIFKLFL